MLKRKEKKRIENVYIYNILTMQSLFDYTSDYLIKNLLTLQINKD